MKAEINKANQSDNATKSSRHPFLQGVILAGKLLFPFLALAIIIWKTDIEQVLTYIKRVNLTWFVVAFFVMNVAHVVSAFRGRYYFSTAGLYLGKTFSVAFYFVGLFFNFILPSGIGGDGYKIYRIWRLSGFSKLTALRLLVSDRASGFFVLVIFSFLLAFASSLHVVLPYAYLWLSLGLGLCIPGYFITAKLLLRERPKIALGALPYSLVVQLLNLSTALCLFYGLGKVISMQTIDYLLLFLISSVISIFPISVGGAGLREVTFLYGAKLFGLNIELGVAFAFLFYMVNVMGAALGSFYVTRLKTMFFQYEHPELIEKEGSI